MTSVCLTESTDPAASRLKVACSVAIAALGLSATCTATPISDEHGWGWIPHAVQVPPWVFGADDGRCSATLIAPRVALSSSYCFADTTRAQIKQLRTGKKFAGRVVALVGGPTAAILPSLILLDTPVPPPVDLPTKRTIRRAQAKHTVPIPAYRLEAQMLKDPPSAAAFGTRLNAYSADTRLPAQGGVVLTYRHIGYRTTLDTPRNSDPAADRPLVFRSVRQMRMLEPARFLPDLMPAKDEDATRFEQSGYNLRGLLQGHFDGVFPSFTTMDDQVIVTAGVAQDRNAGTLRLSGLNYQAWTVSPFLNTDRGAGLLAQQRSGKDFLVGLVQGFAVHTRMSAYWPAVYKTLRENNMDADALVIARQVLGQRRDDSRRVDPGEVRMRVVADGGPPLFFRRIAPARAGYRELPVDGRDDEGWEFLGTDLPDRQTAERQVNIWNSADLAPPLVGAVYAQFNGRTRVVEYFRRRTVDRAQPLDVLPLDGMGNDDWRYIGADMPPPRVQAEPPALVTPPPGSAP